jgi:uncharacterized glyoxalase superfamily protein PhnB
MRGELSPPRPTPSRPVGGEIVLVSAPNPVCVAGSPGMPPLVIAGQSKVRVVEDVEELSVEPERDVLGDDHAERTAVRMILTIEDPDAAFDRAVAAGATIICPIRTEHAWRIGRVLDPFGHHWEIGKPLRS